MSLSSLATYIDHTLLRADAVSEHMTTLVAEAHTFSFKTVCVASTWVPYVAKLLTKSSVGLSAVVGFPLGNMAKEIKIQEAIYCVQNGATEIDMVMQIGKFKEGQYEGVMQEIEAMMTAIPNTILKVIIETALLNEEEIKIATQVVCQAGAPFIKTSTGFSTRGASIQDIQIMKAASGGNLQIKASGGIATKTDMLHMLEAGATRIGTSKGVRIVQNVT